MNNITHRQDVMGRPGRRVYDMRPRATATGGRMPFSGNVWVGGKKLTVPTTGVTQYLSVPLNGTSSCSWVAAMPESQMDSDVEIFDTSRTAGDIHLPGNFGGG